MAGCGLFASPGGPCNANPDPCCRDPQGTQCTQKKACDALGLEYGPGASADDAGVYHNMCLVLDAGLPDLAERDSTVRQDLGDGRD
jgi:hypothetical protein